jgi:AcrR family transcriptional regulator
MGRPKEHGERTRAALLAAAAEILGREGAAAVTVRRVADHVGTSTRAVYSVFGDKDALLRELFRLIAETMRRHHEAVPVDAADPLAEIPRLALAYRAAALDQPHLYDFYLGRVPPELKFEEDDIALAWRSFERVLDAVRRCVESGRFPGHEPEAVGLQLWALVHGLAALELRGFLGDETAAKAHWHNAITAAITGYQRPPLQ